MTALLYRLVYALLPLARDACVEDDLYFSQNYLLGPDGYQLGTTGVSDYLIVALDKLFISTLDNARV